jgi:hypothetical protein
MGRACDTQGEGGGEREKKCIEILVGKPEGTTDWACTEMSFKHRYLRNRMGQRGVYSSNLGWGQVAGCCEHGDEHSGYIKWSLARRHVVRGVGCWAVYFRLTCVQGSGIP